MSTLIQFTSWCPTNSNRSTHRPLIRPGAIVKSVQAANTLVDFWILKETETAITLQNKTMDNNTQLLSVPFWNSPFYEWNEMNKVVSENDTTTFTGSFDMCSRWGQAPCTHLYKPTRSACSQLNNTDVRFHDFGGMSIITSHTSEGGESDASNPSWEKFFLGPSYAVNIINNTHGHWKDLIPQLHMTNTTALPVHDNLVESPWNKFQPDNQTVWLISCINRSPKCCWYCLDHFMPCMLSKWSRNQINRYLFINSLNQFTRGSPH